MNKKLKLIILAVLFFVWLLLFIPNAKAEAPTQETVTDKVFILDIIGYNAEKYKVSKTVMEKVIACESSFNPNIIGDGGKSYGLVQIHMGYWGDKVTIEQAKDPFFAIDFLAEKLSKGKGHLWTCYRNLVK